MWDSILAPQASGCLPCGHSVLGKESQSQPGARVGLRSLPLKQTLPQRLPKFQLF